MWRKRNESAQPELAGDTAYGKQFAQNRAVPMWGGISAGGFAVICFHPRRKTNAEDWARTVASGQLKQAIEKLKPQGRGSTSRILCDNESFLKAACSTAAHRKAGVALLHIPPKSPDLNPAEKFWSWLRRRLRELDWADIRLKRPPVGAIALKARIRAIANSRRGKMAARACFRGLRKVCNEVVRKNGARTRG